VNSKCPYVRSPSTLCSPGLRDALLGLGRLVRIKRWFFYDRGLGPMLPDYIPSAMMNVHRRPTHYYAVHGMEVIGSVDLGP